MATYYLDYVNGNDTNNGSSWALAWKTITSGATAARIAPGDIIRIAKSPAPVSVGNGTWTDNTLVGGGFPATKTVSGAANNGSGLIRITATGHGYSTGDVIQIVAVAGAVQANGAWVITYISADTFDLQNSTFSSAYTSGGTAQKINSKAVVLSTPQTKNICDCETNWTAIAGGDTTPAVIAVSSDAKEGGNCIRLALDSSVQANVKQAYFATGTQNYSAYQKISFWIKNSAAIADANRYTINLCSDTAGQTVVDTFVIPAIPSTGRWLPLTIARNGGGNLGSSIQSIAVYTGSSAPSNSSNILIDNIIACTTNGLNLQSLISKNSAEQGGTETWYGIQSISPAGTVVLLDNGTNTKSNAGRGYSGTSETVTTYIRETIKTTLASVNTTTVQEVMDSGTAGNNIQFQFGYDTGTNTQIGMTIFDGLNGYGWAIEILGESYVTINNVGAIRYSTGISLVTTAVGNTITNCVLNNCDSYGLYLYNARGNIITGVTANNGSFYSFYIMRSNGNIITNIISNNGLSGNYNIYISESSFNNITAITANNNNNYALTIVSPNNNISNATLKYNSVYGIYFMSSNNIINELYTIGNGTAALQNYTPNNYLYNAILGESTEIQSGALLSNSRIYSQNHDNSGYEYIYSDSAYAISQSDGASGKQWRIYPTAAARSVEYPFDLLIAKAYVAAGSLVTVTLKFNLSHATNIGAKLIVKGAIVGGVEAEQSATASAATGDQTVSLTFTPSSAGVIEVYAYGYYLAGAANVTVDQSGTTPIIQQA